MDRISSLPEELLIHILSILSIKEAVQTYLVSKSWKGALANVPVLKFNFDDWVDVIVEDDAILKECEDKFEKFVNGVLKNRGCEPLQQFEYINSIEDYHSEPALKFLDDVALLKPQVVSVKICRLNKLDLPDLIFSCKSLQKLELTLYTDEEVTTIRPKSIHLPSLQNLVLRGVELSDDDNFMQKLSSGCPALETLYLETCVLDISEISSNVLKRLVIYECDQLKQSRISCPCLVSLIIDSYGKMGSFELKNMASLEYASISINLDKNHSDVNLLSSLSNVSQLRLDIWDDVFKEKLEEDVLNCRPFSKLKSLEIGHWGLSDNIDLVAGFLKNSPNLEELSLYLCEEISSPLNNFGSSNEEDDSNGELSEQELIDVELSEQELTDGELSEQELTDGELSEQELTDGLLQREYLKSVRIIQPKQQDVVVDGLIKKLQTLVKTIEEIIISSW
ncbi:F-box family protein [Rhynchospora pubera]|uniref:F-box family protein n=1 Tax=Rhynchospora pubera TaxID=906938 RepID=A0AAV8G6S4_9POAL|nr:F-box family protein [Rhynchospora pubera]